MRLFFWRVPNLAATKGEALVAWSTVCRPISQGGLGIRHIQHTNAALQVMQPSRNVLSLLLRQVYGHSMDWDTRATPRRGDSPFIAGLRESFTQMKPSFRPQLGDGTRFKFWQVDWSRLGRLRDLFPRLYSLALVPGVTVRTQWSDAWCPHALFDQRLVELLTL